MIGELERYHGVVLARLVRGLGNAGVDATVASCGRCAYAVDRRVALYVKYSTSRMSPWVFNFTRAHQAELIALCAEYRDVFVALVCGEDGVACLSSAELSRVLNEDHRTIEWVKLARRVRQKYTVTGSDNRRGFKVAENEFPSKVVAALRQT